MASKDPLNELASASKELKAINKEVLQLEAGLKRVKGLVGTSLGDVKSALSSNIGFGNPMGLGVANATFGGSTNGASGMQPFGTTKKGAFGLGAIQAALTGAGAAYAVLPDLGTVMNRSIGTFNAAQRMPGMTTAKLRASSFGAIKGGISGTGEDVAAMNVLSLGYGITQEKDFLQSMKEVKGAFLGYGMGNATAAMAIGGMHTGDMSANLYQYGISTYNTKTKSIRTTSDIARQIYNKVYAGGRTITKEQADFSLREGALYNTMQGLGMSAEQKDIYSKQFLEISQGRDPNLIGKDNPDNPSGVLGKKFTSEAKLANKVADEYLSGFKKATAALVALNNQAEKLPASLQQTKAGIEGIQGTGLSRAIDAIVSGGKAILALGGSYYAFNKIVKPLLASAKTDVNLPSSLKTIATNTAKTTSLLDMYGNPIASTASTASKFDTAASVAGKSGLLSKILGPIGIITMGKTALQGLDPRLMPDPNQSFWGSVFNKKYVPKTSDKNPLPKPILGNAAEKQWASDVLTKVGVPITKSNLDAMTTWMRFEGGGGGKATGIGKNTANWNPLNTTQGAPGATAMNSVGVKSYLSRDQGLQATVSTLQNGLYGGVLDALKQGNDSSAVLAAVSKSPWGTFKNRTSEDSGSTVTSAGPQTVNINLTISRASDAEAIVFAKQVRKILLNDKTLTSMGSK